MKHLCGCTELFEEGGAIFFFVYYARLQKHRATYKISYHCKKESNISIEGYRCNRIREAIHLYTNRTQDDYAIGLYNMYEEMITQANPPDMTHKFLNI